MNLFSPIFGNPVILTCRPNVNDFSLGGNTDAIVESEGDQTLTITDEPNPDGIRITTGPGMGAPALISICDGIAEAFIGGSSEVRGTCTASVTLEIISGVIQTKLIADDGFTADAILDTDDSFFFDDDTFTMESNAGTAEVTITADDGTIAEISLTEGNAITFDPTTSEITADPANTEDIPIIIDGEESSIPPGDTGLVNVPPTVGDITAPIIPTEIDTSIIASADFTDPGIIDTHTALFDWGDSSTSAGTVTEIDGSGSATGDHTYTTPGTYTVTLTVTDNNGDSDSNTFQFVVIYDPEGGFVTGGGWITSPEGAFIADDTITGKANFGFVSKYKKGASVPTGNTEFVFKAADLNFHSSEFDWLVVAGSNTKFKGTGTINGEGNYGFLVTAFDADVNTNDSIEDDKFRIKIWDKDNADALVYDNQLGADEDEEPSTIIGGGSIVIHDK